MSPRSKVEVKPGQRWAYKVASLVGKRPDIKIERATTEPLELVKWTIVVPISGEATLEVMLPNGSTN